MNYYISDLHLGHLNCMLKFDKRPFSSMKEMEDFIIEEWNKKISDNDIVYILGDISWYNDEETALRISKLNGKKILIKGNHDKIGSQTRRLFSNIYDYLEIKDDNYQVILCHYPILFHKNERHGAIMLYGHIHNNEEDCAIMQEIVKLFEKQGREFNMYNVGCMHTNYVPVSLKEILQK